MAERYVLTPKQAVVLRVLGERNVEASPAEVAVSALLSPNEVRDTLAGLEQQGIVHSWFPINERSGEQLFVLTDEGHAVCRSLAQVKGTPAVGTVLRIPRALPSFLKWLSRKEPSSVEIISDKRK